MTSTVVMNRKPSIGKVTLYFIDGVPRDPFVVMPPCSPRMMGRQPGCHLRFNPSSDTMVSREHAELEVKSEAVYLTDLASAFGTFVNGQRVTQKIQLQHGDRIQFGTGGPIAEVHLEIKPGFPSIPPRGEGWERGSPSEYGGRQGPPGQPGRAASPAQAPGGWPGSSPAQAPGGWPGGSPAQAPGGWPGGSSAQAPGGWPGGSPAPGQGGWSGASSPSAVGWPVNQEGGAPRWQQSQDDGWPPPNQPPPNQPSPASQRALPPGYSTSFLQAAEEEPSHPMSWQGSHDSPRRTPPPATVSSLPVDYEPRAAPVVPPSPGPFRPPLLAAHATKPPIGPMTQDLGPFRPAIPSSSSLPPPPTPTGVLASAHESGQAALSPARAPGSRSILNQPAWVVQLGVMFILLVSSSGIGLYIGIHP